MTKSARSLASVCAASPRRREDCRLGSCGGPLGFLFFLGGFGLLWHTRHACMSSAYGWVTPMSAMWDSSTAEMREMGKEGAHFACSAIRLSAAAAAGMPSAAMRCRLRAILLWARSWGINQQPLLLFWSHRWCIKTLTGLPARAHMGSSCHPPRLVQAALCPR